MGPPTNTLWEREKEPPPQKFSKKGEAPPRARLKNPAQKVKKVATPTVAKGPQFCC